jgi:hypothetical protein
LARCGRAASNESKGALERIFTAGNFTALNEVNQGQEKVHARLAKLQKSVDATQNLIIEYGDTPVPRMAILVPDDMATCGGSIYDMFSRFASAADIVKYYKLYFVCEGCTLFPSTACSCSEGLSDPVRVRIPGKTLKEVVPALKAAVLLFMTVSIASSVAGVKLPVKLPGVSDLAEFAEAVNEFVEAASNMCAAPAQGGAAEDRGEGAVALAPRTRAYGPAYVALADLLKSNGAAPKDNTCQGLLKAVDKEDGKVYWVCDDHAKTLRERPMNASTHSAHGKFGMIPPAVPHADTETGVTATSATDMAALLESAKQKVNTLETKISELWVKRKFAAAMQEVSALVRAHEAFARASDDFAQFAAKETAAKGFQGKLKDELDDNKKCTNVCQGGCGDKLNASYLNFAGKTKHTCKVCGHVVCDTCSHSHKLCVEGYSKVQRVCKECVEAQQRQVRERVEAAEEAAVQSASAREIAERAKADELGKPSLSDVSGASLF